MQKRKSIYIISIVILYGIVLAGIFVWGATYDNWHLREQLTWVAPLVLEINFFLILIGVIINRADFITEIRAISKKSRMLAIVIALTGVLLALCVAPRTHRIFYDEDIYLNIGQNIAELKRAGMCNEGEIVYGEYRCHQLEYNKEPNGWPYLISLLFRLCGPSHRAAFLLNNIVWGASVMTVFLIGWLLFRNETAALFGALMSAFIPEGLRWANTTSAEPASALFAGLALLSMLFYIKHTGIKSLFLAAVLLAFALQFRPESGLILLPAAIALITMAKGALRQPKTYLFILFLLILITPLLIHLYAVKGEGWGAPDGAKFAWHHFQSNFPVNAFFYFKNSRFAVIVTLFFLTGLGMPLIAHTPGISKPVSKQFFWKAKAILLAWFLVFWGIFLFFYAGSYNYGADVRFSLLSYMPIAIIAGCGAAALIQQGRLKLNWNWLSYGLSALILLQSLSFFPYIRTVSEEAWAARYDHKYAEQMVHLLPPHSLVLTHNPNMFLLWGQSAAQASLATDKAQIKHFFQRFKGGFFFHYNFWCNVQDPLQQSFCQNILDSYRTKLIVSFSEQNYKYALYRLEPK